MAAAIQTKVRISVPVGSETVVFVCRRPSAPELNAFLKQRFEAKGKKVKSHLYEAREELMYRILVDAENAEYEKKDGTMAPLNARTVLSDEDKAHWSSILGKTVSTWIDLIPLSWLSSAAMKFEDPEADEEEDGGKN
jgi:hypothetical protein